MPQIFFSFPWWYPLKYKTTHFSEVFLPIIFPFVFVLLVSNLRNNRLIQRHVDLCLHYLLIILQFHVLHLVPRLGRRWQKYLYLQTTQLAQRKLYAFNIFIMFSIIIGVEQNSLTSLPRTYYDGRGGEILYPRKLTDSALFMWPKQVLAVKSQWMDILAESNESKVFTSFTSLLVYF